MRKIFFCTLVALNVMLAPAYATDSDYSKAAGHTGVYVNVPKVWALKCKIKTMDLTAHNNKLGWYTAWPMIVDYKTGRFVQTGYITSPAENINKPVFYVAWSDDGTQINIKYLPDRNSAGNALSPEDTHEYALSLNIDGTVNIQIDGVKYFDHPSEKIKIGITEGTGEFFAEGSNINMDITTKFTDSYYKLRGDTKWRALESNKDLLLYYVAEGTVIEPESATAFRIKGKLRSINKGKFFREIIKP